MCPQGRALKRVLTLEKVAIREVVLEVTFISSVCITGSIITRYFTLKQENRPYGETPGGTGGGTSNVIPPESYDDATVQTLMREANRYLGMPYTFGGTAPASFDCSGFVCWVFSNSGVHNLPRTTAQGIYDQCTPVSAADAKAGDIIFFTGTYNAGRPVTHVGIYCGNGTMVHCGDPIQYTSINTSYWQSHFYGFGRLN